MFYYNLTFADGKSYGVAAEQNQKEFVKALRRFGTVFYFDRVVYLQLPASIELLEDKPVKTYEKFNEAT